jgi:DNA-directed RNA polymerase specialized sigma24 family protein
MYGTRQKWSLTQNAFDGLLASFGADRDIAANQYLGIRRDLVRLFEWRGCSAPDEYADEAMNRCARRIAQGEQIRDLKTYSIGVARMLVREMARDRYRRERPLDEALEPFNTPCASDDDRQDRVEAFRQSLAELSEDDRFLILNYYEGDKSQKIENRKMLSALFGIGASTLRMRALRIRERLQRCTESHLQNSETIPPMPVRDESHALSNSW